MNHETRTTRLHIMPKGEPIFSDQATVIEIDNEASGEFVVVSQPAMIGDYEGKVCIDAENWPALKDAIEKLLSDCRD